MVPLRLYDGLLHVSKTSWNSLVGRRQGNGLRSFVSILQLDVNILENRKLHRPGLLIRRKVDCPTPCSFQRGNDGLTHDWLSGPALSVK